MLKRISIEQLQLGMYVEAIAEQNGKRRISQRGIISTSQQLEQLKSAGVKVLIIDSSKSSLQEPQAEPKTPSIEPVVSTDCQYSIGHG